MVALARAYAQGRLIHIQNTCVYFIEDESLTPHNGKGST